MRTATRWQMTNVVFYDGHRAYVAKFIIKTIGEQNGEILPVPIPTAESEELVTNYISGNGEILKIDVLYSVNFDDIVALKDSDSAELRASYERFKSMWFGED